MYRFIRTATVCNAAHTPAAVGFAMELTGYLNKKYDMDLKVGMEMFNQLNIHWHFETDKLDNIHDFNMKLMQDKEYWGMLDKHKHMWLDGTLHDTIVNFPE